MHLVLASASPRRRELLALLDRPFSVLVTAVPEQPQPGEAATAYVQRLAISKAQAGASQSGADACVIGADTIVVAAGEILEKPRDEADFRRMMQLLSGGMHEVMTAVAVVRGAQQKHCVVTTKVYFKPLSEAEITAYWQSGEAHDKAGGYAIQGRAGKFVRHLEGSYLAVVGLPLYELEQLLQAVEEAR